MCPLDADNITYRNYPFLQVDISMLLACYEAFKSNMGIAGVKGFTVNMSSLVTGVCIATGQDAASVETSNAQLTISPLTAAEWKDLGKYCQYCMLVELSDMS